MKYFNQNYQKWNVSKGACQKLLSAKLSFFEHNDFPLRGEGVPPNSVKEKSAKRRLFLAK